MATGELGAIFKRPGVKILEIHSVGGKGVFCKQIEDELLADQN